MWVCVVACTVALGVPDAGRGPVKPIEELKIDGVGIGTTKTEFLKLHPDAKPEKTDDAYPGLATYTIGSPVKSQSIFFFAGEKMFLMSLQYAPKELKKLGKWWTVRDTLVERYGAADSSLRVIVPNQNLYSMTWTGKDRAHSMQLCVFDPDTSPTLSLTMTAKDLHGRVAEARWKRHLRRPADR